MGENNLNNLVIEKKGKNGGKQFFTLTYFEMMNRILTKYEEKLIHPLKCECCSDTQNITKMFCCEKFICKQCVYATDDENKACKFCQQKIRKDKIKFFDFLEALCELQLRDELGSKDNGQFNESKKNELYVSSKETILHEIMIRKEKNDVTKLLRIQVTLIFLKLANSEMIPDEDYIFKPFENSTIEENARSRDHCDVVCATIVSTCLHFNTQGWDHQIIMYYLPFYCFIDFVIRCGRTNIRYILPDACIKDVQIFHTHLYYIKYVLFVSAFWKEYFPYMSVVSFIPVLTMFVLLLKLQRDLA